MVVIVTIVLVVLSYVATLSETKDGFTTTNSLDGDPRDSQEHNRLTNTSPLNEDHVATLSETKDGFTTTNSLDGDPRDSQEHNRLTNTSPLNEDHVATLSETKDGFTITNGLDGDPRDSQELNRLTITPPLNEDLKHFTTDDPDGQETNRLSITPSLTHDITHVTTVNALTLTEMTDALIVTTTKKAERLTKHTLVPPEMNLEPSFTSTLPTELEMVSFVTATPALPTEIGLLPTKMSDIPIEMSGVSTKMSLYPTEASLFPTETSLFPTKTSLFPTKTSLFLTKTSLLPTEMVASQTKMSLFSTETSLGLTQMSLLPIKTSLFPTETSVLPTNKDPVSMGMSLRSGIISVDQTEMSTSPSSTSQPEPESLSTTSQLKTEPPYFYCRDYKPKSCSGNCGKISEIGCTCDELCLVYNSCCDDFEDVCKSEAESGRYKFKKWLNLRSTCQYVLHQATGSQVISSCPSNNSTDPLTKRRCEDDDMASLLTPVTSKKLRLHFKNVYCMMCNGGRVIDALFWLIAVGFDSRRDMTSIGTGQDFANKIQDQRIFVSQNVKDIVPIRTCIAASTSGCSEKNTPEQLRHRCVEKKENLVSLVSSKQSTTFHIFKNIHCWNCSVKYQTFDKSECKHTELRDLKGIKAPSFQFLLDWKTKHSFRVTHDYDLLWTEMECHLNDSGRLEQICLITKCKGKIVLHNNTCSIENVVHCFVCLFRINFKKKNQNEESVNKTLDMFKPRLSNMVYNTYSKSISIHSRGVAVSRIKVNSESGQVTAYMKVRLYGKSSASFYNHYEHHKFLNSSLADIQLGFSLCACPAYKYRSGICGADYFCDNALFACVDSRGGEDNAVPRSGDAVSISGLTERSLYFISIGLFVVN